MDEACRRIPEGAFLVVGRAMLFLLLPLVLMILHGMLEPLSRSSYSEW